MPRQIQPSIIGQHLIKYNYNYTNNNTQREPITSVTKNENEKVTGKLNENDKIAENASIRPRRHLQQARVGDASTFGEVSSDGKGVVVEAREHLSGEVTRDTGQ